MLSNIDALLAPEETCYGPIEGQLEAINLHRKHEFRIYSDIGPQLVICVFSERLKKDAKDALGSHVSVAGLMRYRGRDTFLYRIDVEKFEVYPPEDEIPHFINMRGAAPEISLGASTEEFVKALRNDW